MVKEDASSSETPVIFFDLHTTSLTPPLTTPTICFATSATSMVCTGRWRTRQSGSPSISANKDAPSPTSQLRSNASTCAKSVSFTYLRTTILFNCPGFPIVNSNVLQLPEAPKPSRWASSLLVHLLAPIRSPRDPHTQNWIGRTAITEIPHEERLQLRACWCSNLSLLTSTLQTLNALGIRSRDSEQKKQKVVLAKQKHAHQIPGFRAKDRKLFLPKTHTDTDKRKRSAQLSFIRKSQKINSRT
jgi:hypothetical protein